MSCAVLIIIIYGLWNSVKNFYNAPNSPLIVKQFVTSFELSFAQLSTSMLLLMTAQSFCVHTLLTIPTHFGKQSKWSIRVNDHLAWLSIKKCTQINATSIMNFSPRLKHLITVRKSVMQLSGVVDKLVKPYSRCSLPSHEGTKELADRFVNCFHQK